MGTWVSAVYCEEQMGRLNVDEFGQSTAGDQKPVTPVDLMPLDGAWNQEEEKEAEKPHMLGEDESTWTPDYEEEPACEKDMGTWVSAVYCEEQMGRLNVDEFGQSTAGDQKPVTPVDL